MSAGSRTRDPARGSSSPTSRSAFQRFQKDQMSDHAAALTYYSLLSLFPALLFGVAALGYFGRQALIAEATDYLLQAGAPRETVDAVTSALESAQSQRSTAATALIVALATSLYGASGAFGAVGRALNVVWRVEEGRNFIRKKLHDVGVDARPARARADHVRADLRRRRRRAGPAREDRPRGRTPPTSG